jgi:Calcineurin-like phosphoesterase
MKASTILSTGAGTRAWAAPIRPTRLVAVIACIWLAGCGALGGTGAGSDDADPIRAAFVVIGPNASTLARVITTDASCPPLSVDGANVIMTVRAVPETIRLRPTRSAPADSKPSAFPVLTCDGVIPSGALRASAGGHTLPLPRGEARRIVVIGDSGCRIKTSAGAPQACNDVLQWPFAQVAFAAAAMRPDLVIHVGDYEYRENPCPRGDNGCAGSPWGYGWDAWNADFFAPARPLLAAAPWIFVRGNHESCDRAGQGWYRFLDARPPESARDCNEAANDVRGDYSDPYAVPMSADMQLLIFDSSNVPVDALAATDPRQAIYTEQMREAFALTRGIGHNFFISHHPMLGFAPAPTNDAGAVYPGNAALQSVLVPINGVALFPGNVQALFSGHDHLFEMASFSTAQPTQFISGNAGARTDAPLPIPLPAVPPASKGATVDAITSTSQYGFMFVERNFDDLDFSRIEARDRRGRVLTSCELRGSKARCSPDLLP